jgi:hypothetical protein
LAIVADLPELRSDRRPAPPSPAPPPPLFGQPPSFGVARDLELMKQGALVPRTPRPPRRSRLPLYRDEPGHGLRSRWASRDRGPTDLWHRLRCRFGRHDMRGGHTMQLGSQLVYVERRCQWCDAPG